MASTIGIFCCYARKDKGLLDELKTHLIPLQREGLISVWNDSDISPGTDWEEEINQHLDTAQLILLLVSPSFMASDYCYSKEMKRAVERHNQGKARVIPVILRPVYWQGVLGKLQALPTDAKPIMSSSWHNQDEAFFDVVTGILTVIEQLTMQMPKTVEVRLVEPNNTLEAPPNKTTDSVLTPAQPQLSAISITTSSPPPVSDGKDIFLAFDSLSDWDDPPPLNEQLPESLPDWDNLPPVQDDYDVPSPVHKATPVVEDIVPGGKTKTSGAAGRPSLTVQQVKNAWDKVKRRAKQKNALVAATLVHSNVLAIEGTAEVAVIVLHIEKEAHYKIISNRLKDVEWALSVEFGCKCQVRLVTHGGSLDHSV